MKICVITGPSSSGKTTVARILHERGFPVSEEPARSIIAEGALHPARDDIAFQEEVARRQLAEERRVRAARAPAAFLDRGVYDQFAFCAHFGVPVPAAVRESALAYDAAFILDALPEFEADGVRIEKDKAEAAAIGERIAAEYRARGVPCVRVPRMSPAERADFILAALAANPDAPRLA